MSISFYCSPADFLFEDDQGNLIARVWRGWPTSKNGDAYKELIDETVMPGLKCIPGYRGGYVLRQDGKAEFGFVVVNFFESLQAVQAFAGPDYTVPVFEPEARELLAMVEPVAHHYDVKINSMGNEGR